MSSYTLKIWLCSVPEELPRLPSLVGASLSVSEIETHSTDSLPSKILITAPEVCASLTVTASGEVTDSTRGAVKKYAAALCDACGGFTEDADGTLGTPTRSFDFPAINLYTEMLTLALWYEPTRGFDTLAEAIDGLFIDGSLRLGQDAVVTGARQYAALTVAAEALDAALGDLSAGIPLDLCCVEMEQALTALGEVDGRELGEEIVSEIFSRFCVGK